MAEDVEHGTRETPHDEAIARVSIPALDALLGRRLNVLDDGFVRVVDYLGGDESIVQAARVSYGRGTRKVHEDRGLIRYLLRHRHTTPFEMCEIKFHVRVPMDTWRQWIRHRTSSVNEYSTRYSIAIDAMQKTPPGEWRLQAKGNRQGSEGFLEASEGEHFSAQEAELQAMARRIYDERIANGVAREQARKDLPLSTYTEAYWKIDLWNLLHFLGLRMEDHAQLEIRNYATMMGETVMKAWVPITWQAFLDYNFHAVHLSDQEAELIGHFLSGESARASELARSWGWLEWNSEKDRFQRHRERQEFTEKMKARFHFDVKWER